MCDEHANAPGTKRQKNHKHTESARHHALSPSRGTHSRRVSLTHLLTHSLTHSLALVHLCRTRSTRSQQCNLTLLVCPQPSSGFLLCGCQVRQVLRPFAVPRRPAVTSGYDPTYLTFLMTHDAFSEEAVFDGQEDLPVQNSDLLRVSEYFFTCVLEVLIPPQPQVEVTYGSAYVIVSLESRVRKPQRCSVTRLHCSLQEGTDTSSLFHCCVNAACLLVSLSSSDEESRFFPSP